MKRRDLVQKIEEMGCVLLRHGGKHDWYQNPRTRMAQPVLTPSFLANQLYRPSYLSGLWALGYHDMIPERVVWLTSVTPRVPRRFENPFGIFDYRSIKQEAFFGYGKVQHGGQEILVARPEKALLDHWHLTAGEWTTARLSEMRYQHHDHVGEDKLRISCGNTCRPWS